MAVKNGPCPGFQNQVDEEIALNEYLLLEYKTNNWVQSKVNFLVGPQEALLAIAKRHKLAWFGHATCHGNLSKTILKGTLKVDDAVVGKGNAGWTTSHSGHHCL